MKSEFFGTGNLGANPEVRDAPTKDGATKVINMSVFFDNQKKTDTGYENVGGFWANVSLFGDRAVHLSELLHKGARVCVRGSMESESYESNGETKSSMKINADFIGLDPIAVESVTFRKSKGGDADSKAA